MRKITFFMLMAVGLLISGNAWAQNVAKIVDTGTEYETFAAALSAVKANQTIKLLSDANAGSGQYIAINKAMTLDLDTYTLTIDKTTYYGLYVYANLTIQAAYNSTTGHYGSIYNAKSSASQAALIISDASCTVTVNSGYLHSNGASAVIMQDDDYGVGSLILSANAELHSDGSNYDIEMNGEGSFVTVNGTHDGLRVLVSNFTDGSKITNNGTLTNMKLVENKTNMVYEGSGTYEFTLGSKVSQNTMTALGANATIAEGYVTSLSSGYYTVVEPSFSVNGVGYGNLQSAMHVSTEEHPVVVLKDVNLGYYGLYEGGYLDLNGKTLTVSSWGIDLNNSDYVFMDNSAEHTGKIVNTSGDYTLTVNPGVNLTLLGGTYQRKNNSDKAVIYYYGNSNPEAVTIDGENTHIIADYGHGVSMPGRVAGFEITVRNGATITAEGFCIANLGTFTDMNTTMNIESGAQLTSTGAPAIYHPGGGYLNISGENTVISGAESGIEIRAGELNMTGGTVACTGTTISCNPNGNGTTTSGAGISVAQHTTTQPIIVNISGGVVSGPFALVQLNPQGNDEENYLKMKVNVTGGKFITTKSEGGSLLNEDGKFGTVTYDANAMLLSQNRRILVSGGYYKDYDPAPFVMPGYVSVLLSSITNRTPEDEQAIEDGYKYKVTKITESGSEDNSKNSGDWHENAGTIWNSGEEPDKLTQVTISGQEIVVSTPATAYGIEISGTEGNTKLTITETGRLMVDMGGITGTTPITFDVQNGGQMAIAPSATLEAEYQPEATVTLVADWAHRKATADSKEAGSLVAGDRYWQQIATPLSDGAAPTPSEQGVSYVNTWNLTTGWTSATWANVVTPFVGYHISSIKKSTEEKIALTFKGKLVGNHADPMRFARIGFSFFGNSYLAPIDIRELLTCLETKGAIDPTVLLYDSENGVYNSINRASFYIPGTKAEIQPLQGFFVFAESATNVDFDYRKAVWDAFCAKAATPAMAPATAPAMQENPFSAIACIDIKAENGAADRVMLFEGDEMSDAEDKGYDAHKMMTSGVNIYAKGSYADLAILATNNLLGSELILKTDANTNYTLSFANIKGEYALYDALTGRTINMVEGATYEFVAQSNATITDRFFVVEAAKAPTTMENVNAQAGSCKFMKNGIMFIERNNNIYNAQGQIVK